MVKKRLSEAAVALVNRTKELEEMVLRHLDSLNEAQVNDHPGENAAAPDLDWRWLAIGRTSIEQGFMAINRAVFQPQRSRLPGDPQDG